jgi:hypothetical protein
VAVSFIGGGNQSSQRKPPICRKSLTNFISCCIEYISPWATLELTTLVVIGTDCIGSCSSNYHRITTTMVPGLFEPRLPYSDIMVSVGKIFFLMTFGIKGFLTKKRTITLNSRHKILSFNWLTAACRNSSTVYMYLSDITLRKKKVFFKSSEP